MAICSEIVQTSLLSEPPQLDFEPSWPWWVISDVIWKKSKEISSIYNTMSSNFGNLNRALITKLWETTFLNLVSDVVFLKNVFYGGNQMSNWILVIVWQQQSMTPQGTPLFPFVSVRDGLKETTLWMEVFSQSVSSNGPDDPGRGPDADIFVLVPPCPRATRRHQDVELGTHSILPAAAPEKTWYQFCCTWQTFFNI